MHPGAGENLRRARGAPVRGRGHMGGAGKYIEMDRLDKVVNMEEGSRSVHKERAEMLGGALDTAQADKAHARLKRMAAFESHDYDPADNDLEEDARRARKHADYKAEEQWKWAMSVLIGVVMGFLAFTVDGLIKKFNGWKYAATTNAISPGGSGFGAWIVFVIISCLLAAVAGGLVSYVEPLAAGSGIPEMKTYLNGVHLRGLLRFKTLAAKLGGIAFTIGSGLIAGKEGPFLHGGGLVGGGLSAFGSHSLGFRTKKPSHFRNDADKRCVYFYFRVRAIRLMSCVYLPLTGISSPSEPRLASPWRSARPSAACCSPSKRARASTPPACSGVVSSPRAPVCSPRTGSISSISTPWISRVPSLACTGTLDCSPTTRPTTAACSGGTSGRCPSSPPSDALAGCWARCSSTSTFESRCGDSGESIL